jgi:rfaE bifunctional protein nucleotidyltransferase chain/domain
MSAQHAQAAGQNGHTENPLLDNPKLFSLEAAIAKRESLRKAGKKLVLTNGCFDLLHPGHVYFLKNAAALGDELWIALNSKESVQALKGPTRPIMDDAERAYALGALECISGVVIFNTPRLDTEILTLKPDIYTKAGDYTLDKLDAGERKALETVNAKIVFLPYLPGFSTTGTIQKICTAAKTF